MIVNIVMLLLSQWPVNITSTYDLEKVSCWECRGDGDLMVSSQVFI